MTRNRSWSLRPDPNRYLSPIVDMSIFFPYSLSVYVVRADAAGGGGGYALCREPGGSLGVVPFSRSDANELQRLSQDSGGPLERLSRRSQLLVGSPISANEFNMCPEPIAIIY